MKYENWISYRYLVTSKSHFLTFLNFISIAGVAIGVMALIVVIGIMTGFGNNLRDKIIGTTPHIMVEKETGIKSFGELIDKLGSIEGVIGVSPYIQGSIFLEHRSRAMGLVIRGINPNSEPQVTKVDEFLEEGSLDSLNDGGIIIGTELARFMGFSIGDQLTLISPGSGIKGEGWRYKMDIVGTFSTGMSDFDMNLVLVSLEKAQQIFGLAPGSSTGIGVKINDPYQAQEIKMAIFKSIGYGFLVKTWIDINRNLFEALFLEKWGLFIILTLMVIIASFNIISTLVVSVSSKVHDIGILKSIGVPKKAIRRIFIKQGVLIGLLGIFWGLVGGMGISYILKNYIEVPKEIYSIDHVPVDIQLFDVGAIVLAAMVISFLATIYPSAKAANLQPVDALRYE